MIACKFLHFLSYGYHGMLQRTLKNTHFEIFFTHFEIFFFKVRPKINAPKKKFSKCVLTMHTVLHKNFNF